MALISFKRSAFGTPLSAKVKGRRLEALQSQIKNPKSKILLDPVGDEDVGLAPHLAVAVRGEGELASVGREHGEAVEGGVEGYLLQARAVCVDGEEVEVAAAHVRVVRGEDDAPAVGEEVGREAGRAEGRPLPLVPAARA